MNLFLSTINQVANTMDNVVTDLETLQGEINGIIYMEPALPQNAQGEHCEAMECFSVVNGKTNCVLF